MSLKRATSLFDDERGFEMQDKNQKPRKEVSKQQELILTHSKTNIHVICLCLHLHQTKAF